jgi:hypothetical protein
MIPSFNKLLEDKDRDVRRETVKSIGNLANHGEQQLVGIAAELTRIVKSSFVKPSQ